MHAPNLPRRRQHDAPARYAPKSGGRVIWRMSLMDGVSLARGGWTCVLPGYDARFSEILREEFIDAALAAADGVLPTRIRRSRHAETWRERIGGEHGPSVYFKVLDPPHGAHVLKRLLRGSRV